MFHTCPWHPLRTFTLCPPKRLSSPSALCVAKGERFRSLGILFPFLPETFSPQPFLGQHLWSTPQLGWLPDLEASSSVGHSFRNMYLSRTYHVPGTVPGLGEKRWMGETVCFLGSLSTWWGRNHGKKQRGKFYTVGLLY